MLDPVVAGVHQALGQAIEHERVVGVGGMSKFDIHGAYDSGSVHEFHELHEPNGEEGVHRLHRVTQIESDQEKETT
jgi:hypothetical protein